MVFSLLRGHQERRRVRNIMVFRKKGILICGGPTGNLVPWNEISNVSLENENIVLYRKNDESGESNEKTIPACDIDLPASPVCLSGFRAGSPGGILYEQ
jgi:hypothetical protein